MRDNYRPAAFTESNNNRNGHASWQPPNYTDPHAPVVALEPANHPPPPPKVLPPPPAATSTLRKSKRHRRRHAPAGPAGVWFQKGSGSHGDEIDGEEEEDSQDLRQKLASVQGKVAHPSANFTSQAWIAMQCDCQWVTPSLPVHLNEAERYRQLRPFVPSQFTMIFELIEPSCRQERGDNPWFCENLLVLVNSIHSSATAHGWTVDLTDETGAHLAAWIEPESVRRQLQRSTAGDVSSSSPLTKPWFRTGCVCWLRNTSLLLSPDAPSGAGKGALSFLLLVGEENIHKVWTEAKKSDISDAKYLEWIERRSQVALQGDGAFSYGDDGDDNLTTARRTGTRPHAQLERIHSPHLSTETSIGRGQAMASSSQSSLSLRSQPSQRSQPRLDQNLKAPPSQHHSPPPHAASLEATENSQTRKQMQGAPSQSGVSRQLHFIPSPRHEGSSSRQSASLQNKNSPNASSLMAPTPNFPPPSSSSRKIPAGTPSSSRDNSGVANSPFASFACTYESTSPRVDLSQRSDAAADNGRKLRKTSSESPKGHSNSNQFNSTEISSPKACESSQVASNQGTPITRIERAPARTSSSKKQRNSSSRKRRRGETPSKLWTGALRLDFSDDDTDSDNDIHDEYSDIKDTESTQPQGDGHQVLPPSKKSLFQLNILEELANVLSSDDDDNGNDDVSNG